MSISLQHNNPTEELLTRYLQTRKFSEQLCNPLEIEDYCLQSMAEASPVKWHLAHTSWFFETFLLEPFLKNYKAFNSKFNFLFNSYYNAVGNQFPRPLRGLQSRPTVSEVFAYRRYVDEHIELLLSTSNQEPSVIDYRIELGINHEQQHQELLLTDLKHAFSFNPLYPVYQLDENRKETTEISVPALQWKNFNRAIHSIGSTQKQFCFDNELPTHEVLIADFQIANRLISNGEYLEFVEKGGYQDAMQWLSDGWSNLQQKQWQHPIYWQKQDDDWYEFSLQGLQPIALNKPVCHLSYYEADAFARWSGARLPTEFEWEVAANEHSISGNFVSSEKFHPEVFANSSNQQFFGDCWEWTSSSYSAYPGFTIADGAIGEYNGKFMCNQMVLRGGSCVTSIEHIRSSYRNFFYADARWQFSGIRLARDI